MNRTGASHKRTPVARRTRAASGRSLYFVELLRQWKLAGQLPF